MGSSSSRESAGAEREPEDVFKALFRTIAGGVKAGTSIKVDAFLEGIKAQPEALKLLSYLADKEDDGQHEALAIGNDAALRELFAAMDTDSDGDLTWQEWSRYVGTRRSVLAKKLFSQLDVEKKGLVPVAIFKEALDLNPTFLSLYNLNGCSTKTLMDQLDANGDGQVSTEELEGIVKKVAELTARKAPSKAALLPAEEASGAPPGQRLLDPIPFTLDPRTFEKVYIEPGTRRKYRLAEDGTTKKYEDEKVKPKYGGATTWKMG